MSCEVMPQIGIMNTFSEVSTFKKDPNPEIRFVNGAATLVKGFL
jgi:hypothetical protein